MRTRTSTVSPDFPAGLVAFVGVLAGVLLHVAIQGAGFLIAVQFTGTRHLNEINAMWGLFTIGLSQLPYMLPAIWLTRRAGHRYFSFGLSICTGLTALLNMGCWGLLAFA